MKRFLSALAACALGFSLSMAIPVVASAAPQTITITTGTAFSPSQITVQAGQPVTLKFTGGGVHGIESKELGIPATTITPGGKTVTFTPQKPGTYTLNCTIPCGPDHAKMTLVIKVVA